MLLTATILLNLFSVLLLVLAFRRRSELEDLRSRVSLTRADMYSDKIKLMDYVVGRFEAVWAELDKKANSRAARKPKDSTDAVSESN